MDYNNFLKNKGIKVTKGRVAILDFLSKAEKSLTVDTIYEECKSVGVDINLSTVYRAMELFEAKGIVDRFPLMMEDFLIE